MLLFTLASSIALAQEPAGGSFITLDGGAGITAGTQGPPDYYMVQTGDTLWEISSSFLGNPYYWPQLWSINEEITNPHWIYPGNRIVFRKGTLLDPPEIGLDSPTGGYSREGYVTRSWDFRDSGYQCGPDVRFTTAYPADRYQALAFLSNKDDVQVYGEVAKARTMGREISERDLVYLKMRDPDAFDCGDVVMIFRPMKRYKNLRFSMQKLKKDEIYRVVAEARVIHRYEQYLTAAVRTSWTEVEREDWVGPLFPVDVELEVRRPKDGDLEGEIIGRVSEDKDMTTVGDTVFVDRGRAHGVRVGDTLFVVEQRDEVVDGRKEDFDLPSSVIGRVVIVRVDDYTSTAVVTDADRDIVIGNRIAQTVR